MAKPKSKRAQRPAAPDLYLVDQPDVPRFTRPAPLVPRTEAQRFLLSSLRANTLTLSEGSAGTGKTYVALSFAAQLLDERRIEQLILTRPLVGVDGEDEKIGALPGELEQKMQFWAMPMLDVLEARLGPSHIKNLMRMGRIRISPMAYLRGSSFDNAFIHCTEAQNTSPKQVKMLLTRVGDGTRICVEGDTRQSDMTGPNGLADALQRLEGMPGVGAVTFTRNDVVRSGFCRDVLDRYEA